MFSYMLSCSYPFLSTPFPFLFYFINLASKIQFKYHCLGQTFKKKKILPLSELDDGLFWFYTSLLISITALTHTYTPRRCKPIFQRDSRIHNTGGPGCGWFAMGSFVLCWASQIRGRIWKSDQCHFSHCPHGIYSFPIKNGEQYLRSLTKRTLSERN